MPLPGLRAGKRRGACAFVLLSLVLLMWFHFLPPLQPPFPLPVAPGSSLVPSSKPGNITVSGLVFYGRRDRASCLRCYLEVGPHVRSSEAFNFAHESSYVVLTGKYGGPWWLARRDTLGCQHRGRGRPPLPRRDYCQRPRTPQSTIPARRDTVDVHIL